MKAFKRDEVVEVKRTTDRNCPWEAAVYVGVMQLKNISGPDGICPGWHTVRMGLQRFDVPARRIRVMAAYDHA